MTRITALLLGAVVLAHPVLAEDEYRTNTRGLDRRNMDTTLDPCADFYAYANRAWLERNPIPDDQSRWWTADEIRERNYEKLHEILDEAGSSEAETGTLQRKVGDFWSVAMDEEGIERNGGKPLQADLDRIAAIESPEQVAAEVRALHRRGETVLFDLKVDFDLKDSSRYIVYATQGGLGLPERDYYTREDEESEGLRKAFAAHVSAMLQLLGDAPGDADASAAAILALETRLAQASLGTAEVRRDPANRYNIKDVKEAHALSPHFSWSKYFAALGIADLGSFSYAHPDFFTEMNRSLEEVAVATWKNYLRWHLVHANAAYLSEKFVNEDFEFYGKTLRGMRKLRPRWQRVIDRINADRNNSEMGEALGQLYVERAFPAETKRRADEMIENLRDAIRVRLQGLEWMSDETKVQALAKLESLVTKIGHPDAWRDFAAFEVGKESYAANIRHANAFEMRRDLAKLGASVDRGEWFLPPQVVMAYYDPPMNEIVFPAAIMQPPLFDGEMDDAVNYGAMGAIIGHEFMHGFDDEGNRFDAQGNMRSWWTDEDRERFEERTSKLVEQYSAYVAIDDLHLNGELTLGENIADLAGLTMSYYALEAVLKKNDPGEIDGFTPQQRFFLAYASAWRSNVRPAALKLNVNTSPHAPPRFRVMGPLSNMPEFARAFGCEAKDSMVRSEQERAVIW